MLCVEHLTTSFRTDHGLVTAVDDVSFTLSPGEMLGVVGESGCGKTVTGKSIMRLLPERQTVYGARSSIRLADTDLMRLSERQLQAVRGRRIAMIFQEPMTALNPVFTIGWQLDEALRLHTDANRGSRRRRVLELLDLVEISQPARRVREYPHQLSGGMRQRVMIAMALACEPEVLIADEPTTALDVTIQAQILRLLDELRRRTGAAILLVTHDLAVVAQTCDRVLVMYAGQLIEMASVSDLFRTPRHPYTRALLDAIPSRAAGRRLPTIEGVVPSLHQLPAGCRFHNRCPGCQARCREEAPCLESAVQTELEAGAASSSNRAVRCFFPLSSSTP